jgi:hypothetical protein
MVKRFMTLFGSLDENKKIFNDIFLACKFSKPLWTECSFYLLLLGGQMFIAGFILQDCASQAKVSKNRNPVLTPEFLILRLIQKHVLSNEWFQNSKCLPMEYRFLPIRSSLLLKEMGRGADIWAASVRVFDAAVNKAFNGSRKVVWKEVLAGEKAFKTSGDWLPQETLDVISSHLVAIKGPLTTRLAEVLGP